MLRRCDHCGFKNPLDVGSCLYCHNELPITTEEEKENFMMLKKMTKGKWGEVGQQLGKNIISSGVSSLKYRFHPIWFIRVKLYRIKQLFINFLGVFGIIILLIVLGLIYKALGGK